MTLKITEIGTENSKEYAAHIKEQINLAATVQDIKDITVAIQDILDRKGNEKIKYLYQADIRNKIKAQEEEILIKKSNLQTEAAIEHTKEITDNIPSFSDNDLSSKYKVAKNILHSPVTLDEFTLKLNTILYYKFADEIINRADKLEKIEDSKTLHTTLTHIQPDLFKILKLHPKLLNSILTSNLLEKIATLFLKDTYKNLTPGKVDNNEAFEILDDKLLRSTKLLEIKILNNELKIKLADLWIDLVKNNTSVMLNLKDGIKGKINLCDMWLHDISKLKKNIKSIDINKDQISKTLKGIYSLEIFLRTNIADALHSESSTRNIIPYALEAESKMHRYRREQGLNSREAILYTKLLSYITDELRVKLPSFTAKKGVPEKGDPPRDKEQPTTRNLKKRP